MFRILVVAAFFVCAAAVNAISAEKPLFQKNDKIGLFGDSITQGGSYASYLQLFLAGTDVQIINIGLSGDASKTALNRIPTILEYSDINVLCYGLGVNDLKPAAFQTPDIDPVKQAAFDQFRASASSAIEQYLQAGKRVYIVTPCAFNEYSTAHKGNNAPYKDSVGLENIVKIDKELAAKYQIPFLDIHSETRKLFKKYPNVKFAPDRLHPDRFVHVIMAANYAKELGLAPEIGIVSIEGNQIQTKGAAVSNFSRNKNQIEFDYTPARLPIGTNADVEEARKFYDLDGLINRETFTVKDLPAGNYELSADDTLLGTFSAAQLAAGIKLAGLATPHQKQADENMKMQQEIENYMAYYSINFRFRFIMEVLVKEDYDNPETRRNYMKRWCESGQKDKRLAHNFRSVYQIFMEHIDGKEQEIIRHCGELAKQLHANSIPGTCKMRLTPVK